MDFVRVFPQLLCTVPISHQSRFALVPVLSNGAIGVERGNGFTWSPPVESNVFKGGAKEINI